MTKDNTIFFTPGPPALTIQSLSEVKQAFGRGDEVFDSEREMVTRFIEEISGQPNIIAAQGSGSLAIEIMISNFLFGKVLILKSGFYSNRLRDISTPYLSNGEIQSISILDVPVGKPLSEIEVSSSFDWVLSVVSETGTGTMIGVSALRGFADRVGAQLALDAVASIGLEPGHELADVVAFSSCKGLFGVTGGCFVASKRDPHHLADSFYLSYDTHRHGKVTGPYNQIQSLLGVSTIHSELVQKVRGIRDAVVQSNLKSLSFPLQCQAVISTSLSRALSVGKIGDGAVWYQPREQTKGATTISHLGTLKMSMDDALDVYRDLGII
jgi:2-aminoethylphosphonate-pyruvate transaminase